MPSYRYRAMNASGELIDGAIAAAGPGDVAQRIERLGLVLVDGVTLEQGGSGRSAFGLFGKPRAEDVTVFTRDLALLLRAGYAFEQRGRMRVKPGYAASVPTEGGLEAAR